MFVVRITSCPYLKVRSSSQLFQLVFLKLISHLFPTSDFRHPVVTPACVFMCQMLYQCKVKTTRDVATGLFLVTLILEVSTQQVSTDNII
jgi:nucleolar protein 14